MLDPRIYRSGLVAVALAVIVVAFSLGNQQAAVSTTIPSLAFNGQNAYTDMVGLAHKYPDRRPGSPGDRLLAAKVAAALHRDGFSVSTSSRQGRTADGRRTLDTVTGTRTGLAGGSIVIVSHRDSLRTPGEAELSGTAALLELARVLAGETQHRSLVLVSTSGSDGLAGATQLARSIPGPVDAVIALGDLAGSRVTQPVLVPFSDGKLVAPTMLRNTVAGALSAQAGLGVSSTSLAGQFAHVAFPLTTTEQGPFGAAGYPAVLVSLTGADGASAANPVTSADRITAMGQAMLATVNALDQGPGIPRPAAYLLLGDKVLPAWAVRLLAGVLILPVLLAAIDGLARARRRGHAILPWVMWVLAGALPFLLALLIVRGAQLAGVIDAPPGPVRGGVVPLGSGGIAVLVVVALAVLGTLLAWRPLVRAVAGRERIGSPANGGAAAAVLLVMCAAALTIWAGNPFAAMLVIPALHLWMWLLDLDLRIARPVKLLLLVLGAVPPVLVVVYYALALSLDPIGVAWNAVLLIGGGHIGIVVAVQWSVVLGCFASILWIVVRTPRFREHEQIAPITVRGPVSYAGPGSLGGTESALRQ